MHVSTQDFDAQMASCEHGPRCDAVKHSTAVIYEEGAVGHVLKLEHHLFSLVVENKSTLLWYKRRRKRYAKAT